MQVRTPITIEIAAKIKSLKTHTESTIKQLTETKNKDFLQALYNSLDKSYRIYKDKVSFQGIIVSINNLLDDAFEGKFCERRYDKIESEVQKLNNALHSENIKLEEPEELEESEEKQQTMSKSSLSFFNKPTTTKKPEFSEVEPQAK